MPKESVYGDPNDRFALDVGWNPDCDVQIGIRTVSGISLVDEFYGQPSVLRKIGEAVVAALSKVPGTDVDYEVVGRTVLDCVTAADYGMESLWWHPGRAQINRLIRLLRKARDAAFGADA